MSGPGDFVADLQFVKKQFYDKDAKEDVPNASDFSQIMMKKGEKVDLGGLGLNKIFSSRSATGAVMSALSEAGSYPSPGFQSGIKPTLTLSHFVCAVGWTGHALSMGTSVEASFQRGSLIERNLTDLKEKLKRFYARMLMWSGTFILGQIAAVSGTTGGYLTMATGSAPKNFFEPGDYLTVRDMSTGGSEQLSNAATGAGRILQVRDDLDPFQIVLTDVTGAAAADYVAWLNLYDTTAIDGIRSMVDNTGTFMGLDRATGANASMRAYVYGKGGASLSPLDPDKLRDEVAVRAELRNSDYKLMWVGSHQTRRSFIAATTGQVRFAGLAKQELGTPGIEVNDRDGTKPFIADQYMIDKEVYVVDASKIIHGSPEGMEGGQMVENNGSPIFQVPGTSTWTDAYRSYMTLRCAAGMIECRFSGKMTTFTPAT